MTSMATEPTSRASWEATFGLHGSGLQLHDSGIAPNAHLVNLRALDKDGQGTDSAVIRALDRAVALSRRVRDSSREHFARTRGSGKLYSRSPLPGSPKGMGSGSRRCGRGGE